MIIGITGATSNIAQKIISEYYSEDDIIARRNPMDLPMGCDEFYLIHGVINGDAAQTFKVNFLDTMAFCNSIFEHNDSAKVCIMGSMSGIQGSHDMVYAGSKAALHLYVETKHLRTKDQHLVAVAPWIVEDAGMTMRRRDLGQVLKRGKQRRLGRWAVSREVADIAHFAMKNPLLCNTVIQAKGGVC